MDSAVNSVGSFPTLLVHLSLAQGGLCPRVLKSRQVFNVLLCPLCKVQKEGKCPPPPKMHSGGNAWVAVLGRG